MSPRSFTREGRRKCALRDLAAPMFRRIRVLISTFLVVFALTAVLGWLRLHTYPSHMVILLSPDLSHQMGDTAALTDQDVHAEAELLKSRDLLEQVVLANGMQKASGGWLASLPPQQTEADRMERAVRALGAQIEVETPSKTNQIEVTYSSPDPALAYGVLRSLSSLYLEKRAAVHRAPGAYPFSDQQPQSYQAALADAEAGLRASAMTEGAQSVSNTLPAQSFDEGDLEREVKAAEQKYLRYLARREQERASAALATTTPVENVAIAVPPALPTLPAHGAISILLIAFVLAVVISLGATCIIDFFDPSFHTPAQVIDLLGVPVVVAVAKRTAQGN